MECRNVNPLYRCAETALVRATVHPDLALPTWPDLTDDSLSHVVRWHSWLRTVWAIDAVAEAVEQASPVLARRIEAMCSTADVDPRQLRRIMLSIVRYLLRMTGRATPFGLFAGVAPAIFGSQPEVAWGQRHRAVARADASWISDVVARLEACPELLRRLPLMVNTAAFVRGDRLVVPYPPQPSCTDRTTTAQVTLRFTMPVRIAMQAARSPIRCGDLVEKIAAEFSDVSFTRVIEMVTGLVEQGALLSNLHAPSSTLDALGYLVEQVDAAGADELPQVADLAVQLREIRDGIGDHNAVAVSAEGRRLRSVLRAKMRAVSGVAIQPVAVDVRLDCSLVLPSQVAREAEKAASLLARLTEFPFGTPGWKHYHNRFFERYGIGSLVPLLDVVDPDVGLGFPMGFLDAEPESREPITARDKRLLALAQEAALDGFPEITLDENLIRELSVGDPEDVQIPSHLELRFQVRSRSTEALASGDFSLNVLGPSRGVGTTTGRFIGLLDPADQEQAVAAFDKLAVDDASSLPVQMSCAPLDRSDAHIARAPALLPMVISLAEHRPPDENTIPLDDLAVGCDRRRLYLASLSRGCRLDPMTLHALDPRAHTPPLARFLTEIGRSQTAVVTNFSWGAAADLPFLPRVRYGPTTLSAARWRLLRANLPNRFIPWSQWREAVNLWRTRRRVPDVVALTEGDRMLRLDLTQGAHLALLRSHLDSAECAVLTDASTHDDWFEGHVHEIVVPLTATHAPRWPALPPISAARQLGRDHGHLPGASRWLLAKLYCHVDRHSEILGHYLPDLLRQWTEPPSWWYLRYRDPQWHLRLRIALRDRTEFGAAARHVSEWATRLRNVGLLGDLQFATTYPETGRWGAGPLMALAEEVFAADSRAVAVQFAQPSPHHQVLAAASFVSIAAAFTGSTRAGMKWLIEYGKITDPRPLDRHRLAEAARLADPTNNWEALRTVPVGAALLTAWTDRDRALAQYRARLRESGGTDPEIVLDSLLHAHHIRAVGIDKDDERTCVRLARAAALAWAARDGRS